VLASSTGSRANFHSVDRLYFAPLADKVKFFISRYRLPNHREVVW
jgi:hypothetical protein